MFLPLTVLMRWLWFLDVVIPNMHVSFFVICSVHLFKFKCFFCNQMHINCVNENKAWNVLDPISFMHATFWLRMFYQLFFLFKKQNQNHSVCLMFTTLNICIHKLQMLKGCELQFAYTPETTKKCIYWWT